MKASDEKIAKLNADIPALTDAGCHREGEEDLGIAEKAKRWRKRGSRASAADDLARRASPSPDVPAAQPGPDLDSARDSWR